MVGQDLILPRDPPSLSLGLAAPAGNGTLFYTTCWFTHTMSQQNQNKSPVCYGATVCQPLGAKTGTGSSTWFISNEPTKSDVDQKVTKQPLIMKDFTTLGRVSCCWQRSASSADRSRYMTRREKGVAGLFFFSEPPCESRPVTHFLSVDDLFGALHGRRGSLDQNSPVPSEKPQAAPGSLPPACKKTFGKKAEDYENTRITKMQKKTLCVQSNHECTKSNIPRWLCQLVSVQIDFSARFLLERTTCALVIAETEVCRILEIFKLWLQQRPQNNPRSFACFPGRQVWSFSKRSSDPMRACARWSLLSV